MAKPSSGTLRQSRPSTEARAVFDLLLAIVSTAHKLRAVGQRSGSVTAWGGGLWGLLHSLETGGPQTVPQLARARPVARQHIQKLADEMAAEGLVTFVENPAHKRSRLLEVTPQGEAVYLEITNELMALCGDFAAGQDLHELEVSISTINDLKSNLSALLDDEDA